VRVLLDENLPHDLTRVLTGHVTFTVQGLGWAGTKNGALLKRAGGECDVFVTMDGNIEHQQDFANLPFGVVVIGAASNRMADLQAVIPDLLQAIGGVRQGEVRRVGTPAKGRGRLR
jgi:predicted nuclease of predicted toxin-antitoxin system